ncbi:hypothetical protein QQ020_17995 [Fulvivirgaceae bacterium BMA12]|uniref:Uncharacterized protein n=1 Tax=Agaribacillus aureus TaxID=3051825 RepID=A0ABT8L885_9BACT|nr:hypothetical protein [Fulvivirgaceae bacterium BMA12]
MKLRFNKNTIRLRVSQSDLQKLMAENELVEKVHFGGDQANFYYKLKISGEVTAMLATCQQGEITVTIPQELAGDWATSGQTGLYHEQSTASEATLSISVEKDFQCLHKRPGENETDNFPNPLAEKS